MPDRVHRLDRQYDPGSYVLAVRVLILAIAGAGRLRKLRPPCQSSCQHHELELNNKLTLAGTLYSLELHEQ